MAVRITLDGIVPATVPTNGWVVKYRIKGTTGGYTTAVGSPFMTQPIVFSTIDPVGTLYEGTITTDCGGGVLGPELTWFTPCQCSSGFTPTANGDCNQTDSIPASYVITGSPCLTSSVGATFSNIGSRIYKPGATTATTKVPFGTADALIQAEMITNGQWANPSGFLSIGPLNREGVWLDANCNAFIDSTSEYFAIGFTYNNTGAARQVYVGIGATNYWELRANGFTTLYSEEAHTNNTRIWHLIPVNLVKGINYINVYTTGVGTTQAIGVVVYDNTAAQLIAATSPTPDSTLNILFKTSPLRNQPYGFAGCTGGRFLDTNNPVNAYTCATSTNKPCNTSDT